MKPPDREDSAPPDPRGHNTARSAVRMFIGEALIIPTGLLVVAYLARRLGPSGYGLFTLAATMVLYVEFVVSAFFSQALVRVISSVDDPRPVIAAATRLRLTVDFAVLALVWLAAPAIARGLGEPGMTAILRLFALDIPLYGLARTRRDTLVGLRLFDRAALAASLRWISRLVLIVVLVEIGLSIQGAVLGSIGASIVEALACRSGVRVSYTARPEFPIRRLLDYAIPLLISYVLMLAFTRVDLFMLKILGATTLSVGIYAAAQNVALTIRVVGRALSPVILSTLSHARAVGDMETGRNTVINSIRTVVVLAPLVALISVSSEEIADLLFGPGFETAGPVLAILAPAALLLVLVSIGWAMLIAAGRPERVLAIASPLPVFAVLGLFYAIPRYGIPGAAAVTLAVSGLCAIAAVAMASHVWNARPSVLSFVRSGITCLIVSVIASLWPTTGILLVLKLGILGTAAVALLVALGEISRNEIRDALALLGDKPVPMSDRNRS